MPRRQPSRSARVRILRGIVPGLLAVSGLVGTSAKAAETPLLSAPPDAAPGTSPEDRALLNSLRSSVRAGLPSLAESFGDDALKRFTGNAALSRAVRLLIADARLQKSDFEGALKILNEIPGDDAAKSLRMGLASYALHDFPGARTRLNAARRDPLSNDDAIWRDVLDGLLAAEEKRPDVAEQRFDAAQTKAGTDTLMSTQIRLLRNRMRLRVRREGDVSKIIDPLPDSRQAYQLAKIKAINLGLDGKADDAVFALGGPLADADLRADRSLTIGLLYGRNENNGSEGRSELGRKALLDAVRAEGFPEIQTAALAALRQSVLGAPAGETYVNANKIYSALTEIANERPDSAVADMLHYVRADIMYETAQRVTAESDKTGLLQKAFESIRKFERYPSSPLSVDALSLTANIAWRLREYRRAADAYSSLAGTARLPAETRAELLLASADCYFLNGDFAPAAAAYGKARAMGLKSPEVRGDALVDEIRATLADDAAPDRIANASKASAGATGIPPLSRLRAEWLVAEAQSEAGDRTSALAIVNRALGESPDAAMRIRFLWLRAMIELNSGASREAAATASLISGLVEKPAPGTSAEIIDNTQRILAQTARLKARALLGDGGITGAVAALRELREKYPDSAAAAGSYLDEGRHLALLPVPRHDAALEVFMAGYEKFNKVPKLSESAANLIYEAAQEALILANTNSSELEHAAGLFNRLMKEHDKSKLYFRAALYMGNTLRRMNRFDDALKVYQDIISTHPDDRDRIDAELAKADCYLKKGEGGANDETRNNFTVAAAEYDRLVNLPGRPSDLAAEAAYKRAEAISQAPTKGATDRLRGEQLARTEAAKGLFQTVNALLDTPAEAANLRTNGRYWAGRSFILIAELYAKNGDYVQARNAIHRLMEYNRNLKEDLRRLPVSDDLAEILLRSYSTPLPAKP